MPAGTPNPEPQRLRDDRAGVAPWRLWGPYLSERQWGTVREDYSPNGGAWDYFPFWHAHQRAYRWGEDGLAGVSDDQQRLCLSLALWNGRDPILKERLYGVANEEGNHGEDVKELYYYLDATPSGSYLKYLYKYPQREYPYQQLFAENKRRGRHEAEYELLDTGLFDDDRYWDVFVEYAKGSAYDLLMRITIHNRGPAAAELHVLPQIWFRNTWSWAGDSARPVIMPRGPGQILLVHHEWDSYRFFADAAGGAGLPPFLVTDNDTNLPALYNVPTEGYFKDAFHEYVVRGNRAAIDPDEHGTKAAAHYKLRVPAGGSTTIRCRLRHVTESGEPFADFDAVFAARIADADRFYEDIQHDIPNPDARLVQRQAFAGLVWTKQFYNYDVYGWLKGDPGQPAPPTARRRGRNADWEHLKNADIISMPDKWEYPWYAAWDLAFHAIPFAVIDPDFAKRQILLLCKEWYMHPNGQLPAYEWNFADVNPPVHAWAAWRVYQIDRNQRAARGEKPDLLFLERAFLKLMLNFTWWVNRKDADGRNVFQGGFLGLDNIGVFDRSHPLPTGGHINQADGTAWMGMYSLNLMRIALELAQHNSAYEDTATKFFEHFLNIAKAMTNMAGRGYGLWNEEDGFYYDELDLPDGRMIPLKVRSMVGLIPLFAVETLEPEVLAHLPNFSRRLRWVLDNRPDLSLLVSRWFEPGRGERRLLSLVRGHRMKRILKRVLDETEFLSDYGVRALSRHHCENPYEFREGDTNLGVKYVPGESDTGMFGGNSNWRGPIWFPVNYLLIESLQKFHHYYGEGFKVECPTGSGNFVSILGVTEELSRRLANVFVRGADGRRACFGNSEKMQRDPHFRDYPLFFEYFHGDTGAGLGASHQTGWTALVAKLIHPKRADRVAPGQPTGVPAADEGVAVGARARAAQG